MKWSLGKTVKIGGIKYRSIINKEGVAFMTLKAKNALKIVDSHNSRILNERIKEHEELAYGEAVMTWQRGIA